MARNCQAILTILPSQWPTGVQRSWHMLSSRCKLSAIDHKHEVDRVLIISLCFISSNAELTPSTVSGLPEEALEMTDTDSDIQRMTIGDKKHYPPLLRH